MKTISRCGTYSMPPMRAELLTAHEEMNASGEHFAFAVSKTYDNKAWEVHTKEGTIYAYLDRNYASKLEAEAAGKAWVSKQEK